jgi:hypothetical protein
MKRSVFFLAGLALCTAPAIAQDAGGLPDLIGVWISEDTVCHHMRAVTDELVVELRITEQDGRFVRGERSWAHEGEAVMNAQGELTTEASEKVIGVFDARGMTVHFVEHDDIGQIFVTVIDDDRLASTYAEPGEHATLCTQTFVRQP